MPGIRFNVTKTPKQIQPGLLDNLPTWAKVTIFAGLCGGIGLYVLSKTTTGEVIKSRSISVGGFTLTQYEPRPNVFYREIRKGRPADNLITEEQYLKKAPPWFRPRPLSNKKEWIVDVENGFILQVHEG